MKKAIGLLMAILIILSAAPILAEETVLVDVAQGRAGFSSFQYGGFHAGYATDGDETTKLINGGSNPWYYVDLGAAYPLEKIEVLLGDTGVATHHINWQISLTNQRPLTSDALSNDTKTVIYSQGETDPGLENYVVIDVPEVEKGNAYRFVAMEKFESGSAISIAEIKVFTQETNVTNPEWLVEIGQNKPAFASTFYPTYMAWKAVDRDINSTWVSRGTTKGQRFALDLGTAYPLRALVFRTRNIELERKNFKIYGSNDPYFVQKDLIYEQGEVPILWSSNFIDVPEQLWGNSYRYVTLEKEATNGSELSISELLIYTTSTAAAANTVNSERAILISRDLPVTANQYTNTAPNLPSNINDTWADTAYNQSSTTNDLAAFIDLGSPQSVDYITFASHAAMSLYRNNLQIVVTNDPSFAVANDVVVHSQSGIIVEQLGLTTGPLLLFYATPQMENNKYRYVGVRFIKHTDGISRATVNVLDVYTKKSRLKEVYAPFTVQQNQDSYGSIFTANTTLVSVTGKPYTLIAAGYDKDGKMVDVITKDIPISEQGVAQQINETLDFTGSAAKREIRTVKTMLWDTLSASRPIIKNKNFTVLFKTLQEVAQGKTAYFYYSETNKRYTDANANKSTDGNETTASLIMAEYGITYVDLGQAYPLEMIEFLNFDTYSRNMGFTVYVTNELPSPSLTADQKTVLYYQSKNPTTATSDGARVKLQLDGTTGYRYIAFEKTAATASSKVIYMYEVKAYIEKAE